MISIYLCDDISEHLLFYKKKIEDIILIENYDMRVKAIFQKPDSLLDALKQEHPVNAVYFLDVDLKDQKDGIELACDIRIIDPRGFIIFITTHEEMAFKTFHYQVEAMDYIIKDSPQFFDQIHLCLSNIWEKYTRNTENPILKNQLRLNVIGGIRFILPETIYFVQAIPNSHKIKLHTKLEILDLRGSLRDIKKDLDTFYKNTPFVYSHKAYLVNIQHISFLNREKREIIFDDASSCPCSIRQYNVLAKLT